MIPILTVSTKLLICAQSQSMVVFFLSKHSDVLLLVYKDGEKNKLQVCVLTTDIIITNKEMIAQQLTGRVIISEQH